MGYGSNSIGSSSIGSTSGTTTLSTETITCSFTASENNLSGFATLAPSVTSSSYQVNNTDVSGSTTLTTDVTSASYSIIGSELTPVLKHGPTTASYSINNLNATTLSSQNVSATYDLNDSDFDLLGSEGNVSVFVEGKRIDSYQGLEIETRKNEVDTFEFTTFITDDTQRGVISQGADVIILEDYQLLFKGRLEKVEYETSFKATCEGEGMESKLLDRKTDRDEYNNMPADDIVRDLVPTETLSLGVIEDAPTTSLGFDHDNLARAIAGAANAVGYDWNLRQELSDNFETDYLDFVEDQGTTLTSVSEDEGFEDGTTGGFTEGGGDQELTVTDTENISGDYSLSLTTDTSNAPYGNAEYTHEPVSSEIITSFKFEGMQSNNPDAPDHTVWGSGSDGIEWEISYDPYAEEITLGFGDGDRVVSVTPDSVYDVTVKCIPGETIEYKISNEGIVRRGTVMGASETMDEVEVRTYTGGPFDGTVSATTIFDDFTIETPEADKRVLTIGENAQLAGDESDDGYLANDITLLGRGDGINQLEAHVYAAANDYTQLSEDLAENANISDIIKVDDTSVLGDVGDEIVAKVGMELINCTITSSTELEINERELTNYKGESATRMIHRSRVSVWLYENITQSLGPFTPEKKETAQADSSVANNGVKQLRETDKTIVDISTLEQVADRELRNRFEEVKSIKVRPSDPRYTKNIGLGDDVTIKGGLGTELDDQYEITGIDISRRAAGEGTTLYCSNRPRRLVERLSEIERDKDTLNAHMQGATNLNGEHFEDNADNAHPLNNKIFVPEDVVKINKFELVFARESFRGYVKNQAHSHTIDALPNHKHNISTTPSSETAEHLNRRQLIVKTGETYTTPYLPLFAISNLNGEYTGNVMTGTVENNSGSSETYDVEFYNQTTDTVLYSDTGTVNDRASRTWNYEASSSEVSPGDEVRFRVTSGSVSTGSGSSAFTTMDFSIITKASHDHDGATTDFQNTNDQTSTSKEAGAPEYGLFEPDTEPDVDIEIHVDGDKVVTVNDVSVGQEVTNPINLEPYLDHPVTGEYHDIELVPVDTGGGNGGRCKLAADINQMVFIESKL